MILGTLTRSAEEVTTEGFGFLARCAVEAVLSNPEEMEWMMEALLHSLNKVWPHLDYDRQHQITKKIEMELIFTDPTRAFANQRTLPHYDAWKAFLESHYPPKAAFTVDYRCGKCKQDGLKLWRGVHGCADADGNELLCAKCLASDVQVNAEGFAKGKYSDQTDQIAGWLPAVPVDDTYWGYSSVPTPDLKWWKALKTYL